MSDIRYNSWLHRSGTGGVYQDSSGRIGIGTSVPAGTGLHVKEGYSGLSAPNAHADTLYLENSGNAGVTIATPNTNTGYLTFADPEDDNIGQIIYRHGGSNANSMGFFVNADERLRIDSSGRVMIGNDDAASMFSVANNLVVGSGSGSEGMTIFSDSNNDGYICFADGTSDPAYRMGQIIYSHQLNKLQFRTNGNTDRLTIDNAGNTNISGVCTATSFVPTEGHLGNRNIIINGDMRVAQRGTSDASADFITTVDRFGMAVHLTEEHVTRAQETLSSSDTGPYEKGFRRAWKLTNGNQTGGADAGGYVIPQYHIEAQDIATSGWNYKSASSYITLSFWVKSSVAQTFYGFFRTIDGTGQAWSFNYALSANTWKKVTKTIPGNSNIDINHDEGSGLALYLPTFMGTDRTNSGNVEETWAAYASSNRTKDTVTTWYTTNDATWHLTGVQLEVGSVATPFEHRSFGDELRRCQRYFYKTYRQGVDPGTDDATDICSWRNQMSAGRTDMVLNIAFPVPMRVTPTITGYSKNGNSNKYLESGIDYSGGNEGTFAGTVYAGRKYFNQLSSGNSVDSGSYAHFHFTAAAEV